MQVIYDNRTSEFIIFDAVIIFIVFIYVTTK